jgi:hypothetical protein
MHIHRRETGCADLLDDRVIEGDISEDQTILFFPGLPAATLHIIHGYTRSRTISFTSCSGIDAAMLNDMPG